MRRTFCYHSFLSESERGCYATRVQPSEKNTKFDHSQEVISFAIVIIPVISSSTIIITQIWTETLGGPGVLKEYPYPVYVHHVKCNRSE